MVMTIIWIYFFFIEAKLHKALIEAREQLERKKLG